MSAVEPIPMDDYMARDELNEMREQEAREAWRRNVSRIRTLVDMLAALDCPLGPETLEAIAADHKILELELGFSPRNRWNG